jgi:citrate synthase
MYAGLVAEPGESAQGPATDWLPTAEAARRLGVKRETLYAYVSRGMLTRRREPGTRESRFDPAEIARLTERTRSGGRAGSLEVVIDSSLTLLDPAGRLWFRGKDAEVACREVGFEAMAEWLWNATPWSGVDLPSFEAPAAVLTVARNAAGALDPAAPLIDRLRVGLAAAATADPLRFDRRPDAVAAAGRRIISVLVDTLPVLGRSPAAVRPARDPGGGLGSGGGRIADRLWARLSPLPGSPDQVSVLNSALVLLADHEMASSTLAARVAASTWADPYLVVTAGLAILGGPLHGGVGDRIVPMLQDAVVRGAPEAIAVRWRLGEKVPGFGHLVYQSRDPRAAALWPLLRGAWPGSPVIAATEDVVAAVTAHGATFPNVDLMLATLVAAGGLVEGSAEVIFAIARTAGWLAHAIEEYEHRLRFRLRAAYLGPAPSPA